MTFDSVPFLVFFSIFFLLYHALAFSFRVQNALALVASCIFYAFWDWRFLGLLLVSAGLDYVAGILLAKEARPNVRRTVLTVSMVANLGILFAFKYFDFFASSLYDALRLLDVHVSMPLLHVALPVGVSFYTFQSMSYTIDVYRHEAEAERNPITYFTFVSFFPHMVAGPIQRAHHLLAQLNRPRKVTATDVEEAVWLLVWGLFQKQVVANGAAAFADVAFSTETTSGWTTVLGTLAFAVQIYCDFNAYSVMARGTGKLLGIEFIWNFNQPYVSTSMQEFWRRWHISLSTWLRDYLYVSLGGSRKGAARTYLNLFLTMLLGGLWHGAAWNFVFWGAFHGGALSVERYYRERFGKRWGMLPAPFDWVLTMSMVAFGWFLFRCRSLDMIVSMLGSLKHLAWNASHTHVLVSLVGLAAPIVLVERWQFIQRDLLAPMRLRRWQFAMLSGTMVALTVAMFGRFDYAFIYFQF